jgi:chromate transporter
LWDIGVFFFKVGAVTFGGGLTIIAFIQDQVVNQLHWITAEQFLDALAIGQVTPGPVIMLAAFVGYKVAGVAGAVVAASAIFLPSFILMLSILPLLDRVRSLAWTRAAMRGISPAVVGAVALTVVQLTPHAVSDVFTGALFVLTIAALLLWKLPALVLALSGGLLGILVRSRFAMRLREFT